MKSALVSENFSYQAGDWWTASENSTKNAWYRGMGKDDSAVYRFGNIVKEWGLSVRCVKDAD